MNSGFLIEMSEHFAKRIRTESGEKLRDQVQLAWRLAFARSPSEDEIQKSIKYVESQTAHFEKTPPPTVTDPATKKLITLKPADIALASYCQLLLGSNQFLYVD